MSSVDFPLVGVAVPVFNGDQYLEEALDALVAQDYPNFEVVIFDNASTDRTSEIAAKFAAKDSRFRHVRWPENRGAAWNFNIGFEQTRGKYFFWAAHDDSRAPSFISRSVEAMEANPDAVACLPRIAFIDEQGAPLTAEEPWRHNVKPTGGTVEERLRQIAGVAGWWVVYGLMRRSALEQTRKMLPFFGGDVTMTIELALLGRIITVPEPLFYLRSISKPPEQTAATTVGPLKKAVANWSDFVFETTAAIWASRLPVPRKLELAAIWFTAVAKDNPLLRKLAREHALPAARSHLLERAYARAATHLAMGALLYPASVPHVLRRLLRARRGDAR